MKDGKLRICIDLYYKYRNDGMKDAQVEVETDDYGKTFTIDESRIFHNETHKSGVMFEMTDKIKEKLIAYASEYFKTSWQ